MGRIYPHDDYDRPAVPELGRRAPRVGILTLDLSSARDLERIDIGGTALWAIDADSVGTLATVRLNDQFSGGIPVYKGFSIRGVPFSRLYVSNTAQAGATMTLLYCKEAQVQGLQVSNASLGLTEVSGNVTVVQQSNLDFQVDFDKYLMAKQLFVGSVYVFPTATQYAYVQLWNPATSGKNLIVRDCTASSNNAGDSIQLGSAAATIGSLVGGQGENSYIGEAGPDGKLYQDDSAVSDQHSSIFKTWVDVAYRFNQVMGPFFVPPGAGLSFRSSASSKLYCYFRWREETV